VTSLLRHTLRLRESWPSARFDRLCERPQQTQAAVLRRLLDSNADTAFGVDHGFSSISCPTDYASRVPVRNYDNLLPYVNRAVAGEGKVLTNHPPATFATTSGTTGDPKFIPVTAPWRDQMAALSRLWMYRAVVDHPRCFDHKVLLMTSPAVEGHTPGGVPYGAMSGIAYRSVPWVVRSQYAVPYEVSLITDYDVRYFVILRFALAHSVSVVAAPNPRSLLRLAEVAGQRFEDLLRAIADGTLGVRRQDLLSDQAISKGELLSTLERGLRPDPDRARELETIVGGRETITLADCWPELALVGCWLGGNAGIQARWLQPHFGESTPVRDLGLIASEGRMTVPIEDSSSAGVLAVHTTFYEFIPEEAIGEPDPPVLLAHEVVEGGRYYIILSGGNGLYRYDINDVVEVSGFHRRTPKVAFVRKGRDMMSITGEKLHLNHVLAAVRDAERESSLGVFQFRLIPDVDNNRYDLLVECQEERAVLRAFLSAFEESLRRQNHEYASKRASGRLGAPLLHMMRDGWSERICRTDFDDGRRELQHKWNVLVPAWDQGSRADVTATIETSL